MAQYNAVITQSSFDLAKASRDNLVEFLEVARVKLLATGHDHSPYDHVLLELRFSKSAGFGVYARHNIARGAVLFKEKPVIAIEYSKSTDDLSPKQRDAEVDVQFRKLSIKQQKALFALTQKFIDVNGITRIVRIIENNCTDVADAEG